MASKAAHLNDFGLIIAYVLPGFVALWGTADLSPPLRAWLGTTPESGPSVAGFLFITVASVGAGLTVSTVRWLVIDTLHGWTGLKPHDRDFATLQQNTEGFNVLVEYHYRYYQFYANTLIAVVWTWIARRASLGMLSGFGWADVGYTLLVALFFLGSRDTFRKYYLRTGQLLGIETTQLPGRRRMNRRFPA